jgi:hypothetical protein
MLPSFCLGKSGDCSGLVSLLSSLHLHISFPLFVFVPILILSSLSYCAYLLVAKLNSTHHYLLQSWVDLPLFITSFSILLLTFLSPFIINPSSFSSSSSFDFSAFFYLYLLIFLHSSLFPKFSILLFPSFFFIYPVFYTSIHVFLPRAFIFSLIHLSPISSLFNIFISIFSFLFILLLLLFELLHDSSSSELGTKSLLRYSLPLLVTSTFFPLPALDLPILPTHSSFSPFHRFSYLVPFPEETAADPGL